MKKRWLQWRSRYRALPRRDRGLVLALALLVPPVLGWQFGIEPARKHGAALSRQLTQDQTDLAALQQQVAALGSKRSDPDAPARAQLQALRTQMQQADERFKQLERSLVPAPAMGQWLAQVLQAQRGLQLVGLRSLPARPVAELASDQAVAAAHSPASAASAAASPASAAGASSPGSGTALFRHGVEISVQGSYADLLAYLGALEQLPQRVFWGPLKLDAQRHPTLVLNLTVYTLSLERNWWSI